jgi:hypothetical protein
MKVKNECDFCSAKTEHLYPINDGLWAICKVCMHIEYELIPKALRVKSRTPEEERERLSLAQAYSAWLDTLGGEEE